MSQSPSSTAAGESGERRPDLKQLYKPVGISAISAAAMCKSPEAATKTIKPLAPPRA